MNARYETASGAIRFLVTWDTRYIITCVGIEISSLRHRVESRN